MYVNIKKISKKIDNKFFNTVAVYYWRCAWKRKILVQTISNILWE